MSKSHLPQPEPRCANCDADTRSHVVEIRTPLRVRTYCMECAGLELRGWFRERDTFQRQLAMEHGACRAHDLRDLVRRSGSHFFDADTMRFFGSRLHECHVAFEQPRQDKTVEGGMVHPTRYVYFVTSERDEPRQSSRLYTVRRLDLRTCRIEEPAEGGGFQGCQSLAVARRRAQRLAAGEPVDGRRGFKGTLEAVS